MDQHKFWQLVYRDARNETTPEEHAFLRAMLILSVTAFSKQKFEEIYDSLCQTERAADCNTSFTPFESVNERLIRIEEILNKVNITTQRLQGDAADLQAQMTIMATNQTNFLKAVLDGNTRLENDIAALRNQGNDDPALAAIADSLEATKNNLKTASDTLLSATGTEQGVDQPLTISPSTATVNRTGTQQFTASAPASFKATSGSLDATGLYTPPSDTTITSDTVTATPNDGSAPATASVSISDAPPTQ